MPVVGTPWWVGSRVTEHLSPIMDSSSSENGHSRLSTSTKRTFHESNADSSDHDNHEKKAKNSSSPCSDKYFILSAADGSSLSLMSPFLLGKAVKLQAGSVADIRKLRNGPVLIEIKDTKQAAALQRLEKIQEIPVKVDAHRTLNYCKGVVKCKDLTLCSNEQIVKELKSQGVVACTSISVRSETGDRLNISVSQIFSEYPLLSMFLIPSGVLSVRNLVMHKITVKVRKSVHAVPLQVMIPRTAPVS